MRRIGCLAVHYGKEYLAWAVKSLAEATDEVHIFYASKPSFGFEDSSIINPDTEDELVFEAYRFAKPHWHRVSTQNEADHRNLMLAEVSRRNGQLMAIADADEIWNPDSLRQALNHVEQSNSHGRWKAHFYNFWRSWYWRVYDEFTPIRIVDMRHPLDLDGFLGINQNQPIYHFGYAQSFETMAYKITCHGHKAEFKTDWLESRFKSWDPITNNTDIHPCIKNFWKAEPTDHSVIDQLSLLMPDHPYRNLDVID